jgi:hypothetical protein
MARAKKEERKRRDPFDEALGLDAPSTEAEFISAATTSEVAEGQINQAVEAIERLPPSSMIPDRFQPRPLLPLGLANRFFRGEIDCYEAAKEWMELADKNEGLQQQIEQLISMGDSFEEHGQIKPITGRYAPTVGGTYKFIIETGERRYWAACLRAVRDRLQEETLLRVEAVARPSRQRQILENRHAEPPNAVSQAREIASLILDAVDVSPKQDLDDPYEFFRQALQVRKPRGLWAKLENLMQLTRQRMLQILGILQLPTVVLEKANWYNLPSRVLEGILAQPSDHWEALTDLAISEGLTSMDIEEASRRIQERKKASIGKRDGRLVPAQSALRGIRGFANAIRRASGKEKAGIMDELADELMVRGDAHQVLPLLEELSKLIRSRIDGAN